MSADRPVVCDLRAIQSPDHRGRGVARWSYELATALERVRPDLVGAYLLDPGWPPPGTVDELLSSGKLAYDGSERAAEALGRARLFHCFSPFELELPIGAVRPFVVEKEGLSYSTVCYDLIPLAQADHYLAHGAQRRRYRARTEVLRQADAVLAISQAAAKEAVSLLGLAEERCRVVGTGVSRHFSPPASRQAALAVAQASVAGLAGPFILYPGGNDARKNIDGLVAAFAALPPGLQSRYQLVVVGELPPPTAHHYRHLARLAGVEERLVLTGFVSDEQLTELYRATDLLVFPSLAEGYGIPVAEALACGAVAAVSDLAPLDELVPLAKGRFDPASPPAMAATIERCLVDERLRERLLEEGRRAVTSWDAVAERAGAVFEELVSQRRRPRRKASNRLAVVSPFPPTRSGVAAYSSRLLAALEKVAAERGEPLLIDSFADGLDRHPRGRQELAADGHEDARFFRIVDGAIGSYDKVLYVLGNSDCHSASLAALRERPGLVLTHDVRLSGLMTFAADTKGAVPGGLRGAIERSYGPQLPARLGADGTLSHADQDRYGLLLLREVARATRRLLVNSEAARRLAETDLGPELSDRLGVLPFATALLGPKDRATVEAARSQEKSRALVASFGIVDPSRRPELLLLAFSELVAAGYDAELALVGPISKELAGELEQLATELGIAGRTRVVGAVEWEEYLAWLGAADVAVQLRRRFFGEASATVSECLAAGVATVVSDIGWMRELPAKAAEKLDPECQSGELAATLRQLLAEDGRRRQLAEAGEAFASGQTFEVVAAALLDELAR